MKYIVTLFVSLFLTTSVFADSLFFRDQRNGWDVFGFHQRDKLNPVCRADKNYNDGSQFSVVKDLADSELYIVFHNSSWNITDQPGLYSARLNFHSGRRISGFQMTYELLNKNTIRIRHLVANNFIPDFVNFSKLDVIMPGSIPNATINLTGTSNLISLMSQCIRVYVP